MTSKYRNKLLQYFRGKQRQQPPPAFCSEWNTRGTRLLKEGRSSLERLGVQLGRSKRIHGLGLCIQEAAVSATELSTCSDLASDSGCQGLEGRLMIRWGRYVDVGMRQAEGILEMCVEPLSLPCLRVSGLWDKGGKVGEVQST